jgi:hypothetical protein
LVKTHAGEGPIRLHHNAYKREFLPILGQ